MARIWTDGMDIIRRAPHGLIDARRVSPAVAHEMRRQFDYNARDMFRRSVGAPPQSEIHHVLPLCLGGNNEPDNLVMIEPRLHTAVHDWLDWQMRGMEVGHIRTLKIPFVQGKYWHIVRRPCLPRSPA